MTHNENPHSFNGEKVIGGFKESNKIEGLWGELKGAIRNVYHTLPGDTNSFREFIYEARWRLIYDKKNQDDKIRFLENTFKFDENYISPVEI